MNEEIHWSNCGVSEVIGGEVICLSKGKGYPTCCWTDDFFELPEWCPFNQE